MHPSLNVSNFSRLPPFLRKRAVAAASGSQEDALALLKDVTDVAPNYRPFLLPVIYTVLNPARIPMILSRFDSSGSASINSDILATRFCLGGLLRLRQSKAIPIGAFADLWTVVWPWIEFLDEYEESLGVDMAPAMARYEVLVSLIRFLHDDESAMQLIDSTPGVHVVVARAWSYFVIHGPETGMSNVSYFIARLWKNPTTWDSAAFDELIVGAGGTRMDLASVVVSHLKRVLPHPYSRVTRDTVFYLVPIAYLVINHQDPPFRDALSLCGIVTALTTSAQALCRSTLDDAAMPLKPLFSALMQQISSFPPIWVTEALRAGLLEIVFTPHHRKAIYQALTALVRNILPAATVYQSALLQLSTSLAQVRHRNPDTTFGDMALRAGWVRLEALAESRSRILDEHRRGAFTSTRACHDIECGEIRPKQELKQCSGCLSAYYCSRTCQTSDWRRGGHRQTCRPREYPHISSRDRSFFLALVLQAYTTSKQEEITEKRLLFMEEHSHQVPYIMFDFTTGSSDIEVGSPGDVPSEFKFEMERTVRSGGQMQLHLVKVLHRTPTESSASRIWPFSLRIGSRSVAA
ncbi:MYND-type domain-containing protein [Mycena sanguinolenta]|uniref:MYND-type domain-containing protein n=1 Tax=Mycena sanguinolenta TaxID=230812 RepID=A0A8H7CM95_9AGAR|nr:MYND-type domain-containing protein [Mycena sanguinolenta]KAF7353468.1 MYND-type domain-containing protein [Mycena sanguinolenta]